VGRVGGRARRAGCVFFFIFGFVIPATVVHFVFLLLSYIVRPSSSCLRKTRSLKAQVLTSPCEGVRRRLCVSE
jgi:hypothetical protein